MIMDHSVNYDADVIIVGGAVAGAALACAMARYNIRTLLLDRRKEPGSMNRGDGLQPRTLEILEQWGALPELLKYPHVKSSGIELRHPVLKTLMNIDLQPLTSSKYNYILNIPHRDIEQGLLDFADKHEMINIRRGIIVEELLWNEKNQVYGVRVKQRNETFQYTAPIVIAADGGLSGIRQQLQINAKRELYHHELVVLHLPRPAWFTNELRTLVNLHRDGAVVFIPLPNQQMRVTVVVPSGYAAQWRKLSDEQLFEQLQKRVPELNQVPVHREGEHIYKMYRMHADQYVKQGVALIGDAAHLTHASSGQGMNMAIQDADLLGDLLHRYFSKFITLEKAYSLYEQIRQPINEEIISRSDFMSSVVYTPSKLIHTLKMMGIFSARFIPGLRKKISGNIARGIAGIEQKEIIHKSLPHAFEPI